MFLKLNETARIASYNQYCIILNLSRDEYEVLNAVEFLTLKKLLTQEFCDLEPWTINRCSKNEKQLLKKLLTKNIVSKKLTKEKALLPDVFSSKGMFNVQKKKSRNSLNQKQLKIDILKGLFYLLKSKLLIFLGGIYAIKKSLEKKAQSTHKLRIGNVEEYYAITCIMNQARLLCPGSVTCLPWTSAYIFMALSKGLHATLNIGVQTPPFFAHAWVEANNTVIEDYHSLPKSMAKIISIPENI